MKIQENQKLKKIIEEKDENALKVKVFLGGSRVPSVGLCGDAFSGIRSLAKQCIEEENRNKTGTAGTAVREASSKTTTTTIATSNASSSGIEEEGPSRRRRSKILHLQHEEAGMTESNETLSSRKEEEGPSRRCS